MIYAGVFQLPSSRDFFFYPLFEHFAIPSLVRRKGERELKKLAAFDSIRFFFFQRTID